MSELFVEFFLFFFYMTANAFINGNRTDFVSILPHPFMTHSMDCNGSWETSAACCCWHEPLTPNRPTWWRRRSKFSQPSVSLERKICECLFYFLFKLFPRVLILDYKHAQLRKLKKKKKKNSKYTDVSKKLELMQMILKYCPTLREKQKNTAHCYISVMVTFMCHAGFSLSASKPAAWTGHIFPNKKIAPKMTLEPFTNTEPISKKLFS